ncbi:hypothetical protein IWW50_000541 [Coemansia erecta]|nr:hypothetical protein IWW50_000541 [Coemansia erecta]
MESVADCIRQRKRFRRMMAESLAASEGSPVPAGDDSAFALGERSDEPGDALLSAEELEMLTMDDLDEAC